MKVRKIVARDLKKESEIIINRTTDRNNKEPLLEDYVIRIILIIDRRLIY